MQSVAAYSRMSAARNLTLNLTAECCHKSTQSLTNAATILNNRILNRFFTNLRYLSQTLNSSCLKRSVLQQQQQHLHSHQRLSINNSSHATSPAASTSNHNPSFLFSNLLPQKPLHLVTAYSGYSKEFINNKNKGANNGAQFLNRKRGIIGDDAWFIASKNSTDVLGVADGVGGWRDIGVDPSKFSSNLMRTCKRLVEQGITNESDNAGNRKTPIEILTASYQALLENKNQSLIGSSTACIIVFNRDSNCLHTANLGDSGFVIIRNNKIVHRSREQQHYFNSPFQIAILPSFSSGEANLFNDSPELAEVSSFELCEGDFIVIATDGLWDNLKETSLLYEISKIKSYLLEDLEKTAQTLAKKAIELAFDPDYISPFAISARKNGINIRGGKPDDVTILLARVSR